MKMIKKICNVWSCRAAMAHLDLAWC
jgi:hypothetical protein